MAPMHRQAYFLLIGIFLFLTACSTSKNRFINREYHTLNTRYNVLFNGKEAFAVGLEILEQVHEDNFFELLPVEPITLQGENYDESTIVPGFDRAEEKAVKAIQKHSMNIKSVQYNRQIDDAYLLLGKARYFDRRFFPALEAFDFLLQNNTSYNVYVQGRIWREKTNIRLNNNDLAIKNLAPLIDLLETKNPYFGLANATLGEAYINKKQLDSASYFIQRAAMHEKNKQKKSRYFFISGQLHEALDQQDSALVAYQAITALKRKAPRKFYINAQLKKRLLGKEKDSLTDMVLFSRMLNNYENNPFKHAIYRAMGLYFLEKGNDSLTQQYFNESLQAASIDTPTRIYNYKDLIDLNFNKANYLVAGQYLDSLIPLYGEKSFERKRTQRKRDNLDEVIVYETAAKETDSLLYLMKLPDQDVYSYFENYINEKREAERLAATKKTKKTGLSLLSNGNKSNFYFYNPSLVVLGKQNYRATWGNRPNVDNWRIASLLNVVEGETKKQGVEKIKAPKIEVETPESYVSRLKSITLKRDSIVETNHRSYLQLGMIYKEKYKNYPLADARLKHLLEQHPIAEFAAPALYHLYRMHEKKAPEESASYKRKLLRNYPETSFAKILNDPENYSLEGIQTPEKQYAKLYKKFEDQLFEQVIQDSEALIVMSSGSIYESKLELLKANAIGRLEGVKSWKAALQNVVSEYDKTPEGQYAQKLLKQIEANNGLEEKGKTFKNYKGVFPFMKKDSLMSENFYTELKEELKSFNPSWNVTIDSYDTTYDFVVVHGIRNQSSVDNWVKNEVKEKENIIKTNYFVVLARDYRNLIKNKSWKATPNSNEK